MTNTFGLLCHNLVKNKILFWFKNDKEFLEYKKAWNLLELMSIWVDWANDKKGKQFYYFT